MTDLQQKFLDALFSEARGDPIRAAELAGYNDPSGNAHRVVEALKHEIIERTQTYLALNAPRAVFALTDLLDEPTLPGAKVKLAVLTEILDRTGVVKPQRMEIATSGGLFILPPKDAVAQ